MLQTAFLKNEKDETNIIRNTFSSKYLHILHISTQ